MKKILLLFVSVVMFAFVSIGQKDYKSFNWNGKIIDSNKDISLKSTTILYCDSFVVYERDSSANELLISYGVSVFDSLLLEQNFKAYELISNVMQVSDSIDYTYNQDGLLILKVDYYNSGSGLVPSSKDSFVYDANGFKVEYYYFYYDEGNGSWENTVKKTYSYDSNGLLTEVISYNWVSSQWNENSKVNYTYNTNGDMIEEIQSFFDTVWVYGNRKEWIYDNNDLLVEYIRYYWDGTNSTWIEYQSTNYTYDGNDFLILEETYNYDTIPFSKKEYYNDVNGKPLQIIEYDYDNTTLSWEKYYKDVYAYDSEGNIINMKYYEWDNSINAWILEEKLDIFYDITTYPNPTVVVPMVFDGAVEDGFFTGKMDTVKIYGIDSLIYDYKYIFYYKLYDQSQSNTLLANSNFIKVYPNPFINVLNVSSDKQVNGVLEIISIDGRLLMTKNINNKKSTIVIPGLKSGIYLVNIKDEYGKIIYKGKFIKK